MTRTELEAMLLEEWPEATADEVKSFVETWLKFADIREKYQLEHWRRRPWTRPPGQKGRRN